MLRSRRDRGARHLRFPQTARLIAEARCVPTWVLALRSADPVRRAAFLDSGVTLIDVGSDAEGQIDLAAALAALGERGITRLLVEGGAKLAASLFRAGLVDRLAWVHAPLLIGGDGVPAIGNLGLAELAEAPGFERVSMESVGADVLSIFRVHK